MEFDEMEYQELIDTITAKILKNLETNIVKKTNWDNTSETDTSFGGTLKAFGNILGTKNIDIIIGEFKKGEGLKKHYHKHPTEEIYYVLEGEIEVNISGIKTVARKGDILFIDPEVIHRPINTRDEICRILFILSPREAGPPVITE